MKDMRRKRYLYHVTKPDTASQITKEGLRTSAGNRTTFAVYLSEKPLSWYKDGLSILKVDISGLNGVHATTFLPDSDEVLFWGDIPAYKLTKHGWVNRITDVTDKYVGRKTEKGGAE